MNNFNSKKHSKVASRPILLAALYAVRTTKAIFKGRKLALAALVAVGVSYVTVAAVLTPSFGIVSAPVLARQVLRIRPTSNSRSRGKVRKSFR